ncbi:Os06g0211000 [Oryza sativa Japonica Group]|uniref:Os06g0211000 protein n=1 Tax=Oryza sativa subsp. japonica TaxID=39947 RepID=A0A0P0WU70_ORYSJ|nr:Os06g0211000 [Oryza sativa Japonica Group]
MAVATPTRLAPPRRTSCNRVRPADVPGAFDPVGGHTALMVATHGAVASVVVTPSYAAAPSSSRRRRQGRGAPAGPRRGGLG